jgi:hypothetical protein
MEPSATASTTPTPPIASATPRHSACGCFIETLARFRADLTLIAEFDQITGEDDYHPLGSVPVRWLETRLIGSGHARGRYADVGTSEWIALLRSRRARAPAWSWEFQSWMRRPCIGPRHGG